MAARAVTIVEEFWKLMATNDFRSVGSLLAEDFMLDWPQSGERIRGRDNYAAMNEQYPAKGLWTFTINRIAGNDDEAVSDVSVTDGVQQARAISFFTVEKARSRQWSSSGRNPLLPWTIENIWLRESISTIVG